MAIPLLFACIHLLAGDSPAKTNTLVSGAPVGIHALDAKGIENFFQLSARIYSGSSPEGEPAFAALRARGIKTIISVDGAKPEVERARRYGIRYVHLPFGYDGVPTNRALTLLKAAQVLPGPIYVHCHHGVHRGPAAAAVICMGAEGWTPERAKAWLKLAGTATNYAGLYKSVEQFEPPTMEILKGVPEDFPEQSKVSPLADVMIQIDERFEHLKLITHAGYREAAQHPDLAPAHEALLLHELLKELRRSRVTENRSRDFQVKLEQATAAADELRLRLSADSVDRKEFNTSFQGVTDACAACHRAYRN